MSSNTGLPCWNWPIALPCVQVSVTDTRVFDIDQDLVEVWLANLDLSEFQWRTVLLEDDCLLLFWYCHICDLDAVS